MPAARLPKPGQCSACLVTFTPETAVIRTASGPVLCERHEELVVPDSIVARGPWAQVRKIKAPSN